MKKKPLKTEYINTDSTTDMGSVSIINNVVWAVATVFAIIVILLCYLCAEQIKAYGLASIGRNVAVYISGLGTTPLIGKGLNAVKKFIQK